MIFSEEDTRYLVYTQIMQKAQKSFDELYMKYGIQPNAWVMSIDVYYMLTQDYGFIPVSNNQRKIATFRGNPIHVVTHPDEAGTIRAIIEMEDN